MGPTRPTARDRFLQNDRYRAEREWLRLEGTAQRDLFRELRQRFVTRNSGAGPWSLDAGSGPGRFTPQVGAPGSRRVAADLSRTALRELVHHWTPVPVGRPLPHRVRADMASPPFATGAFGTVAALGNLVGFAGDQSEHVLDRLVELVAADGTLMLEVAPGPGERSRYLTRLPPTAVARFLRSPVRLLVRRATAEGFRTSPVRKASGGEFRRLAPGGLGARLAGAGLEVRETLAVAPALGADRERVDAVAKDPTAWGHLLEMEEVVGRSPERWPAAAAVLIAAQRKSEG